MALWKEANQAKEPTLVSRDPATAKAVEAPLGKSSTPDVPARVQQREALESVIAADLTIEGKIEGSGHVRLVGQFKGDVHVEGDLTIEPGAKVTGSVRAGRVVIGGELEGNIDAASSVELLKSGMVNGDLKAGSLTVEPGSRMRGQAEFGWDDKELRASRMKVEPDSRP